MKKKPYFNFFLLVLIFSLWAPVASAGDLTSGSFIIRDPVVGVGGGYGSSASFQLFESLDPTLIGVGTSSAYIGHYGFLYFPFLDNGTTATSSSGGGGGVPYPGIQLNCRIADFNCDTYVNIFDLSILLYYTGEMGPNISFYDLDKNNEVGFADVSIVFYYWDND